MGWFRSALQFIFGRRANYRAATPENPSFNLNDPEAWDAFTDGEPASTGVRVNRETALTHSPWWKGVNLLARDVGRTSLITYRRVNGGKGKERMREHPAFKLLLRKPNQYQTALQFRMQITGHAVAGGNGYAYIQRDGAGTPLELWPLDPEVTEPKRENGVTFYVTKVDGVEKKMLADDVLHIKGLGYDGLQGYGVLKVAREDLGLGLGRRKYSASFFKNAARPSVLLTTDGQLNKEQREQLKRSWDSMYASLDNAHRTAVLDRGLKAQILSQNARESQLVELLSLSILDIANVLCIPPFKLGYTKNVSYASLEVEQLAYVCEAVDFWFHTWEAECWDKLLTEAEKDDDSVVVEFRRQDLIQADLRALAEFFRAALGGRPWMVPNEARNWLNMNPLDGWDEPLDPLNMGQGGADNEPEPEPLKKAAPAEEDAGDDESGDEARARMERAIRANIEDTARRMVRRVNNAAERAAKNPATFTAWVDGLDAEHGTIVREALAPAVAVAAEFSDAPHRDCADWLIASMRGEYLDAAGQATAKQLPDTVAAFGAKIERELPARLWSIYFEPTEAGAA